MKGVAAIACMVVMVAACASAEERRQARINDAAATCRVAGFDANVDRNAFNQCVLQVYQADQQRRAAAAAQLMNTGVQLLTPPPAPPPPQPMMCSTYVNGQYINTRCL